VNFFVVGSTQLDWVLSVLTVLVFGGITAYQTRSSRVSISRSAATAKPTQRVQVMGAYVLYVAFINSFLSLLRLSATATKPQVG